MESLKRTVQAVGRALLRAALALFGLALLLSALFAGAVLAIALTVWALLRGRRPPPVRFPWRGVQPPGRNGRVPPGASGAGEVVDIEVREIRSGER